MPRRLAVAAAAAAAVLATAASATAFAAPPGLTSEVPPSPPVAEPPHAYLSFGGLLGGYDQFIVLGASGEGGVRLGPTPLWVHASVAAGTTSELFSNGSGTFGRITAGLEARGCIAQGRVCAIAGADLGLMHGEFSGVGTLFTDSDVMDTADHTIAMPRVGLDIGGARTRFRAIAEMPIDLSGPSTDGGGGGTLTGAIAIMW